MSPIRTPPRAARGVMFDVRHRLDPARDDDIGHPGLDHHRRGCHRLQRPNPQRRSSWKPGTSIGNPAASPAPVADRGRFAIAVALAEHHVVHTRRIKMPERSTKAFNITAPNWPRIHAGKPAKELADGGAKGRNDSGASVMICPCHSKPRSPHRPACRSRRTTAPACRSALPRNVRPDKARGRGSPASRPGRLAKLRVAGYSKPDGLAGEGPNSGFSATKLPVVRRLVRGAVAFESAALCRHPRGERCVVHPVRRLLEQRKQPRRGEQSAACRRRAKRTPSSASNAAMPRFHPEGLDQPASTAWG